MFGIPKKDLRLEAFRLGGTLLLALVLLALNWWLLVKPDIDEAKDYNLLQDIRADHTAAQSRLAAFAGYIGTLESGSVQSEILRDKLAELETIERGIDDLIAEERYKEVREQLKLVTDMVAVHCPAREPSCVSAHFDVPGGRIDGVE